jgi:hypothetical protein
MNAPGLTPGAVYINCMHFKFNYISIGLIAVVLALFEFTACMKTTSNTEAKKFPVPKINLQPHKYIIYETDQPLKIDGKLNEGAWKNVRWTTDFVNITGNTMESAGQQTRAKLLWNKKYLYVGIQVKEKNIWATMTKHDAPLYMENACEVFIDPDGDTQHYLEFGVNALSTTYDLLLPRPYRDGGNAISEYNIHGLKVKVSVDGTVNNPSDKDRKWTAEIAFPIKALKELNLWGGQAAPRAGDQWRIQLARAERQLAVSGNKYKLKTNPKTGEPLPSIYTSWSPQGLVNLHYPEMWGYVQLTDKIAGQGVTKFKRHKSEQIKWAMRKVYYLEKQYHLNHGFYTGDQSRLNIDKIDVKGFDFSPVIHATKWTFTATSQGFNKRTVWLINQNGKIWSE